MAHVDGRRWHWRYEDGLSSSKNPTGACLELALHFQDTCFFWMIHIETWNVVNGQSVPTIGFSTWNCVIKNPGEKHKIQNPKMVFASRITDLKQSWRSLLVWSRSMGLENSFDIASSGHNAEKIRPHVFYQWPRHARGTKPSHAI